MQHLVLIPDEEAAYDICQMVPECHGESDNYQVINYLSIYFFYQHIRAMTDLSRDPDAVWLMQAPVQLTLPKSNTACA